MERRVPFERCFNFRDLGSYRTGGGRMTRWRRLFRSDSPQYMTEEDTERARDELWITTIVDLRRPEEAQPPSVPAVRYENLPLLNEAETLIPKLQPPTADAFADMLAIASPNLGRLFNVLADGTAYPLVFHCGAGIHRTSLVAALVLGAIGVADDDIVEDYTLSNDNMERFIEHRRAEGRLSSDGSFPAKFPRSFFESPPQAMKDWLTSMRQEHGSIRACLGKHGVTDSTLDRLEDVLLT